MKYSVEFPSDVRFIDLDGGEYPVNTGGHFIRINRDNDSVGLDESKENIIVELCDENGDIYNEEISYGVNVDDDIERKVSLVKEMTNKLMESYVDMSDMIGKLEP